MLREMEMHKTNSLLVLGASLTLFLLFIAPANAANSGSTSSGLATLGSAQHSPLCAPQGCVCRPQSVENPSISVGYTVSDSVTFSLGFSAAANQAYFYGKHYYIGTFWCNGGSSTYGMGCGSQGIAATGVSHKEIPETWEEDPTSEYLNPTTLDPTTLTRYSIPNGAPPTTGEYTESNSYSWSFSAGVPFALSYGAYGTTIHLDASVTSTSGITNTVDFSLSNTSSGWLCFTVYTAGTVYNGKQGGMELHVWYQSGQC